MTELDLLKIEAEALINDSLVEKLIVFQDKLVTFHQLLIYYKLEYKQQLKEVLIHIRNNIYSTASPLKQLYQDNVSSPFNPKRLRKWIEDKHFELDLLKKLKGKFWSSTVKRNISSSTTQQVITASLHFVFTLADAEPLLEAMEQPD